MFLGDPGGLVYVGLLQGILWFRVKHEGDQEDEHHGQDLKQVHKPMALWTSRTRPLMGVASGPMKMMASEGMLIAEEGPENLIWVKIFIKEGVPCWVPPPGSLVPGLVIDLRISSNASLVVQPP